MSELEQLEYFAKREQHQRILAAQAQDEDIRAFHETLGEHYARLSQEVQEIVSSHSAVGRFART